MDQQSTGSLAAGGRKRGRATWIALVVASAIVVALLGAFAIVLLARRSLPPPITREDLDATEQRWLERGPQSYDVDLMLSGRQSGPIHVEVRDGLVTRMQRNGVVPSQRRTWDYWSVPNQFATIRQDFDSAENPLGGFGVAAGAEVDIRAEFDPEFGFPRRYYRTVSGTPYDVEWETTSFAPIP